MSSTSNNFTDVLSGVTAIIARTGKLDGMAPDQDYYDAGITSLMVLPMLLEIEDQYRVTIPDDLFIAARTPRAVAEIIVGLQQG